MKRLLSLLAALLLLACPALAEDPAVETVVLPEPLPIDFTAGPAPNPDLFTENGYEDSSITVQMDRVWVGDTHFNVARVRIADPSQLRTALSSPVGKTRTAKISNMAKSNNAVIAIGGDYFNEQSRRGKGYVVRQGEVIYAKLFKTLDILLVDQFGDFHIVPAGDQDALKALLDSGVKPINVFNFGPGLVVDGELQSIPKKYDFNPGGQEPRCAIGQTGTLEYLLVVADGGKDRKVTITNADGTTQKSSGCTIEKLAQFMLDQGCVQAFNLDGGNSALMVLGSENYSKKSNSAERDVSDIIYFATLIGAESDAE